MVNDSLVTRKVYVSPEERDEFSCPIFINKAEDPDCSKWSPIPEWASRCKCGKSACKRKSEWENNKNPSVLIKHYHQRTFREY